jgi:hypothetical protein
VGLEGGLQQGAGGLPRAQGRGGAARPLEGPGDRLRRIGHPDVLLREAVAGQDHGGHARQRHAAQPALGGQRGGRLYAVTQEVEGAVGRTGQVAHARGVGDEEVAVAHGGEEQGVLLGQRQGQGERGPRAARVGGQALAQDLGVGIAEHGQRVALPRGGARPAGLDPVGRGMGQQVLEEHLRGLESPVPVGHRQERPRAAQGEARRVLVGIRVGIDLSRTADGERDGRRALGDGVDGAQLQVLATAQESGPHAPAGSGPPPRGRGLVAKQYASTGRPPIRCSWMMRSSTSGVQPRYQVPSG